MSQTKQKDLLLQKIRDGQHLGGREQLRLAATLSIPSMLAQLSAILMEYIDAAMYDELTDQQREGYWTIQISCIVAHGIVNVDDGGDGITEDENLSLKTKLFTVNTYADNTIRGTKFTKHWRIGGF